MILLTGSSDGRDWSSVDESREWLMVDGSIANAELRPTNDQFISVSF